MHPLRRHGALVAALALVVLAGLGAGIAPTAARGAGPLPACRYDDILTEPRGYDDWSTTLVDTILRVPRSYVPPDLVSVAKAGIAGSGKVRAIVIDDLKAMADAGDAAGSAIGVFSAYRSYDTQVATFNNWVAQSGYQQALKFSARPGHSEHQLGLAIDFRSEPGGSPFVGSWAKTPAGKWMGQHAWEYGFIRSYPAKMQDVTCYGSEAWHYRYLGRDLAAAIHASGQTIREYLWTHYTTAVVPAAPVKTPTGNPAQTGAPSGLPSLEPSLEASPEPSTAPSGSGEAPGGSSSPVASVPRGTPPPIDAAPVAGNAPAAAVVVAAFIAVLTALGLVAHRLLRRGRSGLGL
jgi:D-alanyl-D-alanine carboxypeptidase